MKPCASLLITSTFPPRTCNCPAILLQLKVILILSHGGCVCRPPPQPPVLLISPLCSRQSCRVPNYQGGCLSRFLYVFCRVRRRLHNSNECFFSFFSFLHPRAVAAGLICQVTPIKANRPRRFWALLQHN